MRTTIRLDLFLSGRSAIAGILTLFLVLPIPASYSQIATGADLRIVRLDEPIAPNRRGPLRVQVQDITAGPVAGAEVTFTVSPEVGDFSGGRQQVTAFTDPQGIASSEGFQPSKANVPAEIVVKVRFKDLSASRTLYYNVPRTGLKHGKWFIIAGAAGAAAVGVALARRGNSTGTTSGGPSVQPGVPTLSHP